MIHTLPIRSIAFAAVIAATAALSATNPAAAQGTIAQRQGCESDAFKFCSEFIPFAHQIENCLFKNMRRLTPACQFQMRGGNVSKRR